MSEKKAKILVIDDLPSEAKMVTMILEQAGYKVMSAYSGKEGIEKALDEDFDLVVTDLMMPDIGGIRVLRDIKKSKPYLPVIIMTGYVSHKTAVSAMKLGATHYIEKGFTPLELISEIESALFKRKPQEVAKQKTANKEDMLNAIERAVHDPVFTSKLLTGGVDVLESYNLSSAEKRAIMTGNIEWIEENIGKLSEDQRMWFENRKRSELWY